MPHRGPAGHGLARRITHGMPTVVMATLAACATPAPVPAFGPLAPAEAGALLPFLRDGVTTRSEVSARLGEPDASFDGGGTVVYTFVATTGGSVRQWELPQGRSSGLPPRGQERRADPAAPPVPGLRSDPADPQRPFELVLSFTPDGRLGRHTLVEKPGLVPGTP